MSTAYDDIIDYMITLIPLDDHATISALSCVCTRRSAIYARWLRANDVVDVRSLPQDAEICLCDRMHGTFARALTFIEHYILLRQLRGYALTYSESVYTETRQVVIYQFRYGQLVAWNNRRGNMYENVMVAGELVCIITDFYNRSIIVLMQYGASDRYDIEVARLMGGTVFIDGLHHHDVFADDKSATLTRLRAVDWAPILMPYKTRAFDCTG
jgi:hypothetical protein